jgi:HEAT repeat protein
MPAHTPPPELDEIVATATGLARAAALGRESPPVGPLLYEARHHGRPALDAGLGLVRSTDPVERTVGCDLLGELCAPDDHGWGPQVATALVALAKTESEPGVLASMARAFGRTGSPSGAPVLIWLSAHPEARVRLQAAAALYFCGLDAGELRGAAGPDPELVQRILVGLMGDTDSEVRNWATFELGTQTRMDGHAIRDALFRNTSDRDPDTRDEAILGLARRRDPRAVDVLVRQLREPDVSTVAVEAACYVADARLLPALQPLADSWDLDTQAVTNAIATCDPAHRLRHARVQEQLLSQAEQALAGREPRVTAALYCERLELGVGLRLETGRGEPVIHDFDALINASAGDVSKAIATVLCDLDERP